MIWIASRMTTLCALVLSSGAWLGQMETAYAAPVTDTYAVALTGKQWCEGNPAFAEPFKVKVDPKQPTQNTTLTVIQDPLNTGDRTDLQATLNTQGASPALDAIPLKGRAFPSTKAGNSAQFVLSGTNPSQPEQYLTLRGQAKFDKAGHLLNASGTYVLQTTSTYTTEKKTGAQSGPVDCFNSGTVATKGKALITGTLVDRPVDGVRYITSSNPVGGYTSGGGHYFCQLGETVTFFLGTHQLGVSQPCSEVVTVASLLQSTSLTDPRVVNLAQLLMTLDTQADPDVITIPVPLPAGVVPANIPPFTDPNFDTNVLAALPGGTVLVTEADALAQLQQSLKQLTVTGGQKVTVTSSPAGINCVNGTGTCTTFLPTGTVVTLTATGTGFTGWNGGGCSGTGACVVSLSEDTAVTAVSLAGGGTLTITGAPASVGGTFVPNAGVFTSRNNKLGIGIITAGEAHPTRAEGLGVNFEYDTNVLAVSGGVTFVTSEGNSWACTGTYIGPGIYLPTGTCAGVTVDRVAGTVSFVSAVLTNFVGALPPITLNGTLNFTPLTGISITNASPLPAGIVSQAYSVTLTTLGGTQPFTWSLVSGALPTGLTLNPITGQIAGIPTTEGTSTFTVQVQDSASPQQSRQKQFNLTVNSGSSGGGLGIVTITGGPESLEASFVPTEEFAGSPLLFREMSGELVGETLVVNFDDNGVFQITLTDVLGLFKIWSCNPCNGAVLDPSAGALTLTNVILPSSNTGGVPITLNGTLTFTPY